MMPRKDPVYAIVNGKMIQAKWLHIVASDLLSQAEHGVDSQVHFGIHFQKSDRCVLKSAKVAEQIKVFTQKRHSRKAIAIVN